MNIVFDKPGGKELTTEELKVAFNEIYSNPKHKVLFTDCEMRDRIAGELCDCDGNGRFVLLPVEECREGGKRFMICWRCGEHSHL